MTSGGRRVLWLVLVLLFLMGFVGLAGTQTFINKTGKTVTGITVTFSKDVRITRHDSVFPDQSPNTRDDQFTFSGGDLRNLGRFSITWLPSSGKVTNYEWIKKDTQPAQEPQVSSASNENGSKLPDPNTLPILYGNDYPGPDEQLYQPKADEQIWLTDLDGHGDIYDNDSIKINYAPGFDKSQITKIEVYRNEIKMRFLPDIFDVLTNAQMETFDGNYFEHSPASSQIDHAIMGYEYRFKIQTADHVWILKKAVKSGFRWRPKEIWAHIDSAWTRSMERLSYDNMVEFFTILKANGFTGISVDVPYYMMSVYDSEVFEQHEIDPNITPWNITTPTSEELTTLLEAITEVGLDVHARGQIYISKKYNDTHGGIFRMGGVAEPSDITEFFHSNTQVWLKLVPLLNKYHVKLITPFTEMDNIEKYPEMIKRMYSTLSEEFDGELGFEEATDNMLMGTSVISHQPIYTTSAFRELVRDFTFWDWVDAHGRPMRIEYSCWAPTLETQEDQRAFVMAENFVKFWKIPTDYYRAKYPKDPIMFGEIGVYNADGVGIGGATYWNYKNKVFDEQEVADIWYAYLKGAKGLGIESLDAWQFPLGDLWPIGSPGDFFINIGLRQPESPAYRIIKAIIKPEE